MTRAAALAGLVALAAGQGFALPTFENTHQMEWEEAAPNAQGAAAVSVEETIDRTATQGMHTSTDSMSRILDEAPETATPTPPPAPQPSAVQEAVLDAIMKEMQNIFRNTLTVPGWDTVDTAAETVRQIVNRVRERLAAGMSETEPGRTTMSTAAALRGVTSDFLKEIMVQEAVIETLWAVLRDSQARPWITNEQQAMHVAATQAVHGFLARMQDRLRATGFSEEEIVKMLPRSRTCTRDGVTGMFDTCTEPRNLGKKGYGYGYSYGYPTYGYSYPSYGWGYPVYSHSYDWGYPIYSHSYSYPAYYYGWGYPSYRHHKHGHYRRLVEGDIPETAFPSTPITPMTPTGAPLPPVAPLFPEAPLAGLTGPMAADLDSPLAARSLYSNWGHHYPSYSYSYYPAYSYGYSPAYWGRSYYSYPFYGYGYRYRGWGGHHGHWRRLEVPDLNTPIQQTSTTVPSEKLTEATPTTVRSSGITANSFRRVGETRTPLMTTGSFYTNTNNTQMNTPTQMYPTDTVNDTQQTWETYN